MKLVDTNVLLYAVDTEARRHEESREWLDASLAGVETIGFAWLTLVGFVRIATNSRIYESPLTIDEAIGHTRRWTGTRAARVLEPGPEHFELLHRLLDGTGTAGNLVSDAHLAAIALAHRATVVTFDNDFDRFPGVRWQPPSDQLSARDRR